jgi:hypothetical protein
LPLRALLTAFVRDANELIRPRKTIQEKPSKKTRTPESEHPTRAFCNPLTRSGGGLARAALGSAPEEQRLAGNSRHGRGLERFRDQEGGLGPLAGGRVGVGTMRATKQTSGSAPFARRQLFRKCRNPRLRGTCPAQCVEATTIHAAKCT